MIPKPPPREGQLGFLFIPPFRVQGLSVAGEATAIQVPELDVCFDMGACPRSMLASKFVALSHGHMDHVGGLAYYFSQRQFQGMGTGVCVCHPETAKAVRGMMDGYVALEQQRTPYEIIELAPEEELEIKNSIVLRAFALDHTCTTNGYVIVEKRSKLKEEFVGMPQEKLREIKDSGTEITKILDIPLVAYLSDTAPGSQLIREDVRRAQVVVSECTFVEPDHVDRAKIGKHLHLENVAEWLPLLECDKLVLMHVSRRTNLMQARKRLRELVEPKHSSRVEFLMDHRANRSRYERQQQEAERAEMERQREKSRV